MFLPLLSLTAAAEECVCPDEDPAAVYSRMTSAMLARSGQSLTTELTPMVPLKGELPERAYIANTWDACDLEAGPSGSMMLLLVDEKGFQTRCGGAGALSRTMTSLGASGDSDLSTWLRLGGWSDETLPLDVVTITLKRELKDNQLEYPEDTVAVGNYAGLDLIIGSTPIRSAALRPEGPRWMVVDGLQLDDEFFYIRWGQEVTGNSDPWQWESHSIWRRTEVGVVPLWRVESRHIPVLRANTEPEVIAAVPSTASPMLAALDGGTLALLDQDGLHAVTLNPDQGWSPPEVIAAAAERPVFASAGDRAQVVWSRANTLHTRQYRPSAGWGKPIVVAEGTAEAADVVVAMSRGGDVLVSWTRTDGARLARILSSRGEWSDAATLAPPGATNPHAAINSKGRAALVWTQDDRIHTARYSSRSGWDDSRAISQPGETADMAQVGIDRWGRLLVAWRSTITGQGLSDRIEIFARTWAPIRGWQPLAEPLLTSRRGEISPPVVVVDPMGESVVLWLERGARASIWARHHTLRRGWDEPVHATGLGDARSGPPRVTSHGGGSITAVWIGQNSAWTTQFIHGLGWGRISALESGDMAVHEVAIASVGESATLYLWTQGERESVQLLYREAP
ncbi:MAG: hypothetical protein ACI8RZ_005198 [Myxococcota bacterium]|jgi:hypothetical protein